LILAGHLIAYYSIILPGRDKETFSSLLGLHDLVKGEHDLLCLVIG
jgi:hypothetical protein